MAAMMMDVRLHEAEPMEDDARSELQIRVGKMHCVPLAAIYAAYVARCLMRADAVEGIGTFEARLRHLFSLQNENGESASRAVISEGIVYGVWFNDQTKRFVLDPTAVA
ncbi:MAG TPA: hypothetical protein VKB09_06655 [Thermomicrobiales bacterium]|nr:hypothetical protein [Thermomicrobiales bacterium]